LCNLFLIHFLSFFKADHHIDNAEELKDFIEEHTQNSIGKVVTMQKHELKYASNANAILNLKTSYEYVWKATDIEGTIYSFILKLKMMIIEKYHFRKWPCYCQKCRHANIKPCENEENVGKWYSKIQKSKGTRSLAIKSIVHDDEQVIDEEQVDEQQFNEEQ